jgi:hypothetical protein
MTLDLTDEETLALLNLLVETIETDPASSTRKPYTSATSRGQTRRKRS